MMTTRISMLVVLFLLTLADQPFQSSVFGQITFQYTGQNFTEIDGDFFSTNDSIFGTVTFDMKGDESAAQFNLSVVRADEVLFNFNSDDIETSDFTVFANDFQWDEMNQEIVEYDLLVAGDVASLDGEEQFGISDVGDNALYDFEDSTESAASNFSKGEFAAVPEPSSAIFLCCGVGLMIVQRRRKLK